MTTYAGIPCSGASEVLQLQRFHLVKAWIPCGLAFLSGVGASCVGVRCCLMLAAARCRCLEAGREAGDRFRVEMRLACNYPVEWAL